MKASWVTLKKFCATMAILAVLSDWASGQPSFLLPAHESLRQVSWYDSIYRYPEFLPGHLVFDTGFAPPETFPMNYNMYFLSMDFISHEGDTLQIKPPKELKLIELGDNLYLLDPQEGFLEILDEGFITLAGKTYLTMENMEFVSGTDPTKYQKGVSSVPSLGSSNARPNIVISSGSGQNLNDPVDERGRISEYNRYYRKTTTLYFVDSADKAVRASPSALKKMVPARKKEIKAYLKHHPTNFDDLDALKDLLVKFQPSP